MVFIAIHLLPGDPVAIMLGEQAGSDPLAVSKVRAQLGLDRPLGAQFAHWIGALAHGDLGVFAAYRRTGGRRAGPAHSAQPELIGAGLLAAVALGVPLA